MRILAIAFGYLWAAPYSVLGLMLGVVGLLSGGHAQVRSEIVEFYGGFVRWFVTHLPGGQLVLAFTLGHTVLGQTDASLDIAHEHEIVHVRQYSRWGLFMGPAYLLSSFVLWCIGRDPYRDNPFEREAYEEAG